MRKVNINLIIEDPAHVNIHMFPENGLRESRRLLAELFAAADEEG
jgi:hypothetical protein